MQNLIQKKSLADEVASRIQEQISLGHYKLHEQLPIEPELMKSFGVGRSTIREAIKLLTNAGLLRVQQGVGTFVENSTGGREPIDQRLKRASMKDLNEVRQLLEMKIAEKAAANRTAADLAAIKTQLELRKKMAHEGQTAACIEADIQFHVAIAEASKNEILADLYKSTSIHMKNWFIQLHKHTSVFLETHSLHEQLFKAIEAGNTQKAWNTAAKITGHISFL